MFKMPLHNKALKDIPVSPLIIIWFHLDFMALCHNLKAVKVAQALWHDQEFMEKVEFIDPMTGDLGMNMTAITDTYLVKKFIFGAIRLKIRVPF